MRFEGRYPKGPNGEELDHFSVPVGCKCEGAPEHIAAVALELEQAMNPAPELELAMWLARLEVRVPRRSLDEATKSLQLHEYISLLAGYPADVAHDALLGRAWKFWPSWAELQGICDALSAPRRQMLAAARAALKGSAMAEPPRERVSPEAARRILEEVGFATERATPRHAASAASIAGVQEAGSANERKKHWTDTVDPEGPEMQALRDARQANPLMRQSIEKALGAKAVADHEAEEPIPQTHTPRQRRST